MSNSKSIWAYHLWCAQIRQKWRGMQIRKVIVVQAHQIFFFFGSKSKSIRAYHLPSPPFMTFPNWARMERNVGKNKKSNNCPDTPLMTCKLRFCSCAFTLFLLHWAFKLLYLYIYIYIHTQSKGLILELAPSYAQSA